MVRAERGGVVYFREIATAGAIAGGDPGGAFGRFADVEPYRAKSGSTFSLARSFTERSRKFVTARRTGSRSARVRIYLQGNWGQTEHQCRDGAHLREEYLQ